MYQGGRCSAASSSPGSRRPPVWHAIASSPGCHKEGSESGWPCSRSCAVPREEVLRISHSAAVLVRTLRLRAPGWRAARHPWPDADGQGQSVLARSRPARPLLRRLRLLEADAAVYLRKQQISGSYHLVWTSGGTREMLLAPQRTVRHAKPLRQAARRHDDAGASQERAGGDRVP